MPYMNRPAPENRSILKDNLLSKDFRDLFVSSVLFILSFPPSPFGFLIYFAFIPLFSLSTRKNAAAMTGLTYLTGLTVNWVLLSWIIPYSFPKFTLLATLNAAQFALLGWWLGCGFKYLKYKNVLFFPFIWTGLEHLRGMGDLAYNWLDISNTQTNFLYVIQMADTGGSDLLVFWICVLNVLIWFAWRSREGLLPSKRYISAITILVMIPLFYGSFTIGKIETLPGFRVHIFQPDTDPVVKWDPEQQKKIYHDLIIWTRGKQNTDPADLLVWPETAIPFELRNFPEYLDQLGRFDVPLLTGVMDFSYRSGHKHRHNAVFAFGQDSLQVYHKLRPVPVEEVIPYQRLFPALQRQAVYDRYLSPGISVRPLQLTISSMINLRTKGDWWQPEEFAGRAQPVMIGPSICFEVAFHDPAREQVMAGADVHLVVTNDAWFGYSHQPFQHLNIARLRAVETRRSVIFCANSGFSAFIDHRGRIAGRTNLFERMVSSRMIPVNRSESFYLRTGNWVAVVSLLGIIFWGAMVLKRIFV